MSYKYCFLNKNRYFKYMLSPKYDPSPKDHSKKSRKSRNDFILLTVNKQLNFVKKKKKSSFDVKVRHFDFLLMRSLGNSSSTP